LATGECTEVDGLVLSIPFLLPSSSHVVHGHRGRGFRLSADL